MALRSVAADFPAIATGARGTTLAAVAVLMFAIALGASWLPAVRVSRIAPVSALRAG